MCENANFLTHYTLHKAFSEPQCLVFAEFVSPACGGLALRTADTTSKRLPIEQPTEMDVE